MVSALQKVFTYLQKIAAGMEQVVVDQADNNGEFLTEFDRAQFGLKMVSKSLKILTHRLVRICLKMRSSSNSVIH